MTTPQPTSPPTDVAVIIPAHRCPSTIDAALASVAAQTRPPREVVIADDASGDATPELARAWSDRLPVTVVELTDNQGPGGARRAAIAASDSDRIALLDSDDVWMPDHLESMIGLHDRHGGVITADALRWIPGRALATEGIEQSMPVPPRHRQHATILGQNFIFIGSLFRRDAYDEAGGFRDFRGPEDWDLWIRMVRNGATIRRGDHPTVLYRLSPTSISADDRMVAEERRVASVAMRESTSDEDRDVLRRTLRRLDSKASMYRAYALAREHRTLAARWAALGGLRGPGRVPTRCVALALAPRRATAARDRRVHDPRWWLRV